MIKFPPVLLSLVALPSAAFAQLAVAPAEFVMRFQPPDGVKVKMSYRLERTRLVEGQPQVKDVGETRTEGVFKRVGAGFEYAPRTVSSTMNRNGNLLNDPIVALMSKVPVTFVISAGGEATSIKGYGEVEALLKSTVSPQVAAALAPIVNEAAMAGRETAEWNARYADWADGEFAIGQVIDVKAPQPLPNGETLTYTIRTTIAGWEPCPAGQCVRLEQIYESDAAALANIANGVMQRVTAATPAAAGLVVPSNKGARVSGSLTRLIDPKTMLIYSEQVRRIISMNLQVAGKGLVPTTQEEVRTYAYVYE
jgi:hypothetical protein